MPVWRYHLGVRVMSLWRVALVGLVLSASACASANAPAALPESASARAASVHHAVEASLADHAVIALALRDGSTVNGDVTMVAESYFTLHERPGGAERRIAFSDVVRTVEHTQPRPRPSWGIITGAVIAVIPVAIWLYAHCLFRC